MGNKNEANYFKDGDKTAQHTPNTACAAHDVVVNRCEKPLTAQPRSLQMSLHQKKGLRSFKSRWKGQGVFHNPCSIAMNQKTGYNCGSGDLSHRVQLFDSKWKFLRTIVDKGTGKEIMDEPISVAFTSSGNILVVQLSSPWKKQLSVFTERGHYITDISKHVLRPHSVSVRKDGNLLVCDVCDAKVLSLDGTKPYGFLTKLKQTIKAP